jgi:hypothetical protein
MDIRPPGPAPARQSGSFEARSKHLFPFAGKNFPGPSLHPAGIGSPAFPFHSCPNPANKGRNSLILSPMVGRRGVGSVIPASLSCKGRAHLGLPGIGLRGRALAGSHFTRFHVSSHKERNR